MTHKIFSPDCRVRHFAAAGKIVVPASAMEAPIANVNYLCLSKGARLGYRLFCDMLWFKSRTRLTVAIPKEFITPTILRYPCAIAVETDSEQAIVWFQGDCFRLNFVPNAVAIAMRCCERFTSAHRE